MKFLLRNILLFSFVLTVGMGCSVKKNTSLSRGYHNLTAHYNAYFNARESYRIGMEKVSDEYQDNFSEIIPILYPPNYVVSGEGEFPEMDVAVVKCLTLIKKHSITRAPKKRGKVDSRYREFRQRGEWNDWVDDAHLLIGKSLFMKGEFFDATNHLEIVSRKLHYSELRAEARVWLARVNIEKGLPNVARDLLESVERDLNAPRYIGRDLQFVWAELNISEGDLQSALLRLERSLKYRMKKADMARVHFAMGQINKRLGYSETAALYFGLAAKNRDDRELQLSASLKNIETSADLLPLSDLTRKLIKMSRQAKNEEYRSRILLSAARLYLSSGFEAEAVALYRVSVALSESNSIDKLNSSLELGNLLYKSKYYRVSKLYYDTVLISSSSLDKSYPEVAKRAQYLGTLTKYISEVKDEDNIVASPMGDLLTMQYSDYKDLPDRSVRALIHELITVSKSGDSYSASTGSDRGWYFYSPKAVSLGQRSFTSLWGDIQLEDNWRFNRRVKSGRDLVSNKDLAANSNRSLGLDAIEAKADSISKERAKESDSSKITQPAVDESLAKSISDKSVDETLLYMASIYSLDIGDNEMAAMVYRYLYETYPDLETTPFVLHRLYKFAQQEGDSSSESMYRGVIENKFPNSNYAKVLRNPNFLSEFRAHQDSLMSHYDIILKNYSQGDYRAVLRDVNRYDFKKALPDVRQRIEFIEAVAGGVLGGKNSIIARLNSFVETNSESPLASDAGRIAEMVKDKRFGDIRSLIESGYINKELANIELSNLSKLDRELQRFESDSSAFYYVMIVYNGDAQLDLNRFVFHLAIHNIDYYPSQFLDIEKSQLNQQKSIILVRSFESKSESLEFIEEVEEDNKLMERLNGTGYEFLSVSSRNYRIVLEDSDLASYKRFYVKEFILK